MAAADVALIIPVLNEEHNIRRLLESVLSQTRPPEHIIVVDSGSTDGTRGVVEEFAASGAPVQLLTSKHKPAFPGTARNLGAESTTAQWLAFTDAGVTLERDWLSALCRTAETDVPDVVYGNFDPILPGLFSECAAIAYIPAPVERAGQHVRGPSIASAMVRRAAWESVGGFPDYRAGEDLIFMERLETAGLRIAYTENARAHWEIAGGFKSTYARFSLYSYHNLVAGLGGRWHAGVLRQYLFALPFLLLALRDVRWLAIPVLGFAARVGKTVWQKRRAFALEHPLNPIRWPIVAAILLTIDAATLAGAVKYRAQRTHPGMPAGPAGLKVTGSP